MSQFQSSATCALFPHPFLPVVKDFYFCRLLPTSYSEIYKTTWIDGSTLEYAEWLIQYKLSLWNSLNIILLSNKIDQNR